MVYKCPDKNLDGYFADGFHEKGPNACIIQFPVEM